MEGAVKTMRFHLDPRTKIYLMFLIATSEMFILDNILFMGAVAAIPFILLIINRQYKWGTSYIILFGIGLFTLKTNGMIVYPMLINMFAVLLQGLVLKLFPAFAMASYVVNSTKASEFVTAMTKMKVSRKIIIPISVIFRFIPTMKEEYASIRDAMKMREIQFGSKRFWKNPVSLVEYRIVPFMVSIVKIGDELSAAALSRGIDNPVRRTNLKEVKLSVQDTAVMVFTTVFVVVIYFTGL